VRVACANGRSTTVSNGHERYSGKATVTPLDQGDRPISLIRRGLETGRPSTCQGEGRGFESRRPLQVRACFCQPAAHRRPWIGHRMAIRRSFAPRAGLDPPAGSQQLAAARLRRPRPGARQAPLRDPYGERGSAGCSASARDLRRGGRARTRARRDRRRVHRALVQAHRWGWTWLSRARPPRVEPSETVPPGRDELALLVAEAERVSSALDLFLLLGATTGQRHGELLVLRWGDVDFGRAKLKIQRFAHRRPERTGPLSDEDSAHELRRARRGDSPGARRVPVKAVSRCGDRRAVCLPSDGGSTPWVGLGPDAVRRLRPLLHER
jgi:hypothetical protein